MRKNKLYLRLLWAILMPFLFSVSANASLKEAVNNIATSQGGFGSAVEPHKFRTATQRGFHAGSVNIRFPVKAINLVSVERAAVNYGCDGISGTFGGMAFISSDEILEYLKTIAKGVPALIYGMTLKAIAAPLEASLNNLYTTMERLSASLKNSCEASQAIVAAAGSVSMGGNDTLGKVGGILAGGLGSIPAMPVAGINSALDSTMNWGKGLMDKYIGSAHAPIDPKEEIGVEECMALALSHNVVSDPSNKDACSKGGSFRKIAQQIKTIAKSSGMSEDDVWVGMSNKKGNLTWNALQLYGIAPNNRYGGGEDNISKSIQGNLDFANLMLSMLGYRLLDEEGRDEVGGEKLISGNDVMAVFMCGNLASVEAKLDGVVQINDAATNKQRLAIWCQEQLKDSQSKQYYVCPEEAFAIGANCLKPQKRDFKYFSHQFIDSETGGMVFYIADLLDSSVEKAYQGTGEFEDEERQLMILAPFPLYEVYNIAAATPTVASDLLESNALLLSYSIVNAMLSEMISSVSPVYFEDGNPIYNNLPRELHSVVFEMQNEIAQSFAQNVQYVDYYKQRIQSIVATIKDINKSVLEGSMALGLDGQTFVEGLSKMSGR